MAEDAVTIAIDPAGATRMLSVLYFAWVREKVGRGNEVVTIPAAVTTVADLIGWLRTRGAEYDDAFSRPDVIRAAIDQTHAKSSASIVGAREVAFFPPVTGG